VEIIPPHPYVNVANGNPSTIYMVNVFARLALERQQIKLGVMHLVIFGHIFHFEKIGST